MSRNNEKWVSDKRPNIAFNPEISDEFERKCAIKFHISNLDFRKKNVGKHWMRRIKIGENWNLRLESSKRKMNFIQRLNFSSRLIHFSGQKHRFSSILLEFCLHGKPVRLVSFSIVRLESFAHYNYSLLALFHAFY